MPATTHEAKMRVLLDLIKYGSFTKKALQTYLSAGGDVNDTFKEYQISKGPANKVSLDGGLVGLTTKGATRSSFLLTFLCSFALFSFSRASSLQYLSSPFVPHTQLVKQNFFPVYQLLFLKHSVLTRSLPSHRHRLKNHIYYMEQPLYMLRLFVVVFIWFRACLKPGQILL